MAIAVLAERRPRKPRRPHRPSDILCLAIAALLVCATSSAARGDATSGALARWFNAGRCADFDRVSSPKIPYVKSAREDLIVVIPDRMRKALPVPWYVYDSHSGIAYRHVGQDSGITDTLRFIGNPPLSVPRASLAASHTTSGVKLGTSAAAVVAILGKPFVAKACGLERFVYIRFREGEPDELDLTIKGGRVVEIYSTLGG
jgi:hypothetical protein